jgi:uncharacterized protein (DUF433 family)
MSENIVYQTPEGSKRTKNFTLSAINYRSVAVGVSVGVAFGAVAIFSFSSHIMPAKRPTVFMSYGHPMRERKEAGAMISFETDLAVYGGHPMIPDTGLPAWIVAAMLQSGESMDDVLAAYPYLTASLLERFVPVLKIIPLKDLGAPLGE